MRRISWRKGATVGLPPVLCRVVNRPDAAAAIACAAAPASARISESTEAIPVLIPPDSSKRKTARPGWDGGRYTWMRRLLASDAGRELYHKRHQTIEPVFGQIKSNRKIDRFQRRGRTAVRSEWRLAAMTHNLLKLHQHQIAVTGA